MVITQEEIDATLQSFRNFTDGDIDRLIKTFQRKQEPLLVYVAAVVEREELNDHEYDLLITNVLLAWELMRKKCRTLKRIKMDQLQDVDESVYESDHSTILMTEMDGHPQANLMKTVQRHVIHAEAEVREEKKPLILATLKHLVDSLVQACVGS